MSALTSFETALTWGGRAFPASAVTAAVADVSEALTAAGVGPGVRVAHGMELTPVAWVAMAAVARVRGSLVLMHPGSTREERARLLEATRPSFALVDSEGDAPQSTRTLTVEGLGAIELQSVPSGSEPTNPEADVLLPTSGSGGAPKVVCHTWDGLRANAAASNQRLALEPDGVWLCTLAWAHVGGLAVPIRVAEAGATLAFGPERFDAGDVLGAIEQNGVTHVSLVPTMLHRLLELGASPPATLRIALLGGAATPAALVRRAREAGWPVALTYGMSEMGSQVATALPEEVTTRPRSVGKPLDGVSVEVRNADGEGIGELFVRSPSAFVGYLGEGDALQDGWFATGDLGQVDDAGEISVVGRSDDRIVSAGVTLSPSEIEGVLAEHPGIGEVVVLGLPDAVYGEIVTAVVVRRSRGPDDPPIETWVRSRLSGARVPRRWVYWDELPHTPTGKVDRSAVRVALEAEAG